MDDRMNAGGDTIVRHPRGVQPAGRRVGALHNAKSVHTLAICGKKPRKTPQKARQFKATH
ncbi:hypothetical protein [Burkholderia stagnalis]